MPLTECKGLGERRERRREKRAILQGLPPNRERTDSDEPAAKKNKSSRKEHISRVEEKKIHKTGKAGKVPLGVALMESFTAKNTKKDRLTVRDGT